MAIRQWIWAFPGLIATALLSACQPAANGDGALEASDAWARASAPGQQVGAVYLTVRNATGADDRLVGGSTQLADAVEIHAMRMDGAIMRMRRQEGVDIPAHGSTELSPGGTHLMLVGLKAPLTVGATVPLSLDFARAGRKDVVATVEPIGASGPAKGKR